MNPFRNFILIWKVNLDAEGTSGRWTRQHSLSDFSYLFVLIVRTEIMTTIMGFMKAIMLMHTQALQWSYRCCWIRCQHPQLVLPALSKFPFCSLVREGCLYVLTSLDQNLFVPIISLYLLVELSNLKINSVIKLLVISSYVFSTRPSFLLTIFKSGHWHPFLRLWVSSMSIWALRL